MFVKITVMGQLPQVSSTLDLELYGEIKELAEKESRSISSMVAILLAQAVKERTRKRKNAKEDSAEYQS